MPNTDGFYSSRPWYKARARVLKACDYRCAMCSVSVYGKHMAHVDHIVARKARPDLALDLNNLQVLCVKCHNSAKQKHEGNPEMEAIGLDGLPDSWR